MQAGNAIWRRSVEMVMIYLVCAVVVVVVVFVVVFAAGSESGHDEAVPASVASGYIGAVAAESDAFVRFLRGVEGSPRCWEVLSSMDVVGGGSLCGEGPRIRKRALCAEPL